MRKSPLHKIEKYYWDHIRQLTWFIYWYHSRFYLLVGSVYKVMWCMMISKLFCNSISYRYWRKWEIDYPFFSLQLIRWFFILSFCAFGINIEHKFLNFCLRKIATLLHILYIVLFLWTGKVSPIWNYIKYNN